MMKKIMVSVLVLFMLLGCQSKASTDFTVGVLQWAEHPALTNSYTGMVKGLKEAGLKDRVNVIYKNANEDVGTASQIVSQFVQEGVDVIFAIATPSAQTALNGIEGTDIKVVFAAVTDAASAGLVENVNAPEGAVTGVSDAVNLGAQLDMILEILPEMKNLGILFNTSEANSAIQIEQLEAEAANKGVTIIKQGVSNSNEISQTALQVASQSDAMFIITDNMIASAAGLVVDKAKEKGVGVFMIESGQFDQGILASDSISYELLGIQAGHMVSDLLLGNKEVSQIPVETSKETELLVSQSMADELGIVFPDSILERADVR